MRDPKAKAKPAAAKPAKAVTSYDVARLAGVSQSAVSRALTPGCSVSAATRARVAAAVTQLGYRPNAIARSLITQRSNMVAIIVANIDFHPELTAHLSRAFASRGQHVLLFTLDHEAEADHVIDQIWQYRVDGVVAAVTLPRQHVMLLGKRRTPLVFINRTYPDLPTNSVCCDQAAGEWLLVDRLVAAGHRRFGIIKGPADSVVSAQRVDEALKRLHNAGIDDIVLASGTFDYPSGRAALNAMAETTTAAGLPTAILCANDMMACGALDAARHDLHLAVPTDVAIVGFDGLAQASWASYDLVTIRQPTRAMVDAAVDMLIARLDDPTLGTEIRMFAGALIEGSSAVL